jgi:5'-3' exonuclease
MGIPGLFGRWINKRIKHAILSEINFRADNLFLDFNSIIHQVFNSFRAPDISPFLAQELLIEEVLVKIKELVAKFRPKKGLIICIDGVAPLAKIKQQRMRRSSATSNENSKLNRSIISPGTIFMERLDQAITLLIKNQRDLFPSTMIFDGSKNRGEGEQKIFKYLKSRKDLFTDQDIHLIFGLDADLIILSLFSGIKNIYLVRESEELQFLRMDIVRNYLIEQNVDIDEFVLVFSMFGNDFLPKLLAFSLIEKGIEDIIGLLKAFKAEKNLKLLKPSGGIRNIIKRVNEESFAEFLSFLANKEPELLQKVYSFRFKYPIAAVEETRETKDLEKLKSLWYSHLINLFWLESEESRKLFKLIYEDKETLVDEERIRKVATEYIKGIFWVFNYYQNIPALKEREFNTFWFYPYYHAPMIEDLFKYFKKSLVDKEVLDISLVPKDFIPKLNQEEALVSIIPLQSLEVLPFELRKYYENLAPFGDLFPEEVTIEHDGTFKDHEAIVFVPFFNRKRLEFFLRS